MFEAFNAWLKSNGHNEWSKELFGPRFAQHAETVRHGVEVARPSQLRGLSRLKSRKTEPPARARVYQGVRFQTASDKGEYENGPSGPTPRENPPHIRVSGNFPKGWSGRSNSPTNTHGTCTKCGQRMRITEPGQTTHPACKETSAL
jgi:hypothetical protein